MPQDLKTLLGSLAVALKERVDAAKDDDDKKAARDEFLDEVRDALPEAYNAIAGASAKSARDDEKKATQRVAKERDALKAQVDELREKLEESEKSKPDVAALTAKAEAARKRAEEELVKERAERRSENHSRALKDATKEVERALRENGSARMRARSASREVLQLQADGIIRLNDEGEVEFYNVKHPTEKYTPGRNGDAPIAQLVRDVIAQADPLDLESAVDRGAGIGAAGTGTRGVPARRTPAPGEINPEDPAIKDKIRSGNYGAI